MKRAFKNVVLGLLGCACIIFVAASCDSDEGGCPGVIIPACTSQYLDQCPSCGDGDPGYCIGYGFEPDRCCGCGDPP